MTQSWAALALIRERVFADIALTPDALRLTFSYPMRYALCPMRLYKYRIAFKKKGTP